MHNSLPTDVNCGKISFQFPRFTTHKSPFSLIWAPFAAKEVTRTYRNPKRKKKNLRTWIQQCVMVLLFQIYLFIEIRPQKTLQRTQRSQRPVEGEHSKKAYFHSVWFLIPRKYASDGGESVEQITTQTLDGEYPLAEEVKLPTNVTVEEYYLVIAVMLRWLYTNLVYFVQEISLLYDSYVFGDV